MRLLNKTIISSIPNVYDISVSDNCNYIITTSDIVVHNSGKGFTISSFMEGNKFKIFDVDELKRLYIKLNQVTGRYKELEGLDLKNPDDVAMLHNFIKKKDVRNKISDMFFKSLSTANPDALPNILFDVTMKDMDDIYEYVPALAAIGYKNINMHLIWALAPYDEAVTNNRTRPRQVPEDILLSTHEGAANVFQFLLYQRHDIFKYDLVDGSVYIVSTKKIDTTYYPGDKIVKDFTYWQVKKPGQSLDKKKANSLKKTIAERIPVTDNTSKILKKLEK